VFYRPSESVALAIIESTPRKMRTWLRDHYKRGGSLMREATPDERGAS